MVINGDLMVINGDLMVINGDLMVTISSKSRFIGEIPSGNSR